MAVGRDEFQTLLTFIENSEKIEDLIELHARISQHAFSEDQVYELYLAAVTKYPAFIATVPMEMREIEMCLIVLEKFHFSTFLPPQLLEDDDIQYAIVSRIGTDLRFIPAEMRAFESCVAAVNQTPAALPFVPNDFIHKREFNEAIAYCRELIPQYPPALTWLPVNFLHFNDCQNAVKDHPEALQFIPKEFQLFNLYKSCVEGQQSGPWLPWVLTVLANYKDVTSLTDKDYQRLVHMIVIKNPVELLPLAPPAMHFELCLDIVKANKSGLELVKQLKPKINLTDEQIDKIENRVAAISANKKAFLEHPPEKGKQLKASDVPAIIQHYSKKYGIHVYLNGETDYGKETIRQFGQQTDNLISQLKNDSIKYAVFYYNYYNKRKVIDREPIIVYGPRDNTCPLFNITIKTDLSKYLDEQNYPRKNLSQEELGEINKLLLSYLEKDTKLKHEMDSAINTVIEQLPNLARDKCLDKTEAIEEIRRIQPTLKEGESVGYYFTSNHRELRDHFEVYIVSRDMIIRPVDWGNVDFDKTLITRSIDIADASINDFVRVRENPDYKRQPHSNETPRPQATFEECGTLGMLSLKELLQQDGDQLKDLSLIFPYYKTSSETYLTGLFLPAPHALHYSQSEGYNKVIQSMLADTEKPITIVHNEKIFTVTTIKSKLMKTQAIALQNEDQNVADKCSKLLAFLPEFSQKWLAEYNKAMSKREMMDLHGQNRFLNYKSIQFHGISAGFFEHRPGEAESQAAAKTEKHKTSPRK